MAPSKTDSPRTLTQMFRDWDDTALSRLLLLRPDLAAPAPTDYSQIASRSTTRHSVSQGLDLLTAFELWVAQRVCAYAGGAPDQTSADAIEANAFATMVVADIEVSGDQAAAGVPTTSEIVDALQRLLGLGLLWGDSSSLRAVRAMASSLTGVDPKAKPEVHPPRFTEAPRQPADLVDKVAAGSAFELVRRIDVLVEHCDHHPAILVKSGELASRETRTFGALLDLPAPVAGLHIKIARSAGLLGSTGSELRLIPTTEFDDWQSCTLAAQWERLATAWLDQHEAGISGWLKRLCLQGIASLGNQVVLSPEQLHAWVSWQRPRRAPATVRPIASILDQAAWVGVTGLGTLSSFGSLLGCPPDAETGSPTLPSAPSTLEALLPPRVAHVLVQADLTAIAPGPLDADAARDLGSLADVESRGGATVYRFSAASLKRAQSLGWRVPDIVATLERRSSTPLPQPLLYLIQDLERLRSRTQSPADIQSRTEDYVELVGPVRAPTPKLEPTGPEVLTLAAAQYLVHALRHTEDDASDEATHRPQTGNRIDSPLATLREAVETGEVVWFGYVDTKGASGERLVVAKTVDEGRLHARDSRTDEALTVPLHRITSAHIIRRTP